MNFLKLFFIWCVAQHPVIAQNATAWSSWQFNNLYHDTYRRTRTCVDSDANCIKQEATPVDCLEECRNVGNLNSELDGFNECKSVCYKGEHNRNLNCWSAQNKTCVLTQTKHCYNDKVCFGYWSSWVAADGITNCEDRSPKRFIKTCSLPCEPPEATGGPVRQSKFDFDPACPQPTTTQTTTTLAISSTQVVSCKQEDCVFWDEWNNWSNCRTQTNTHTRKRTCKTKRQTCKEDLIEESTKTCESILILGLSIGISAVVVFGVFAAFCLKCRQVRHRRKKEMNANTNLLHRQSAIPSIHSSTWTLYNTRRRLPNVPGSAQTPSQIPLPSPPYSRPFDAINNSPPPKIRMTDDSIYATITND